jgi:hypothetical protein
VKPNIAYVPKKKKRGKALWSRMAPMIIGGTLVTIEVAIHPITFGIKVCSAATIYEG